MFDKILIATDGSELAGKAVDHGLKLAQEIGASVVFVTVTEMWSPFELAGEAERGKSDPIGIYEGLAEKWAQKILDTAETAARNAGINCETVHVSDRVPAEGIIATAQTEGCDLIVMASHGRRGINRLRLGSQTAEVLADCKLPVLVLR